jgi:hypothetical protein
MRMAIVRRGPASSLFSMLTRGYSLIPGESSILFFRRINGGEVNFEPPNLNSFRRSVTNRIGMIVFEDWLSFRGVSFGFILW